MNGFEHAVFVSYAWDKESERTVDALERAFAARSIRIIRDKEDIKYKDSIQTFEQRLGRGQCVILVIGDKYLRSEHCMYELLEIEKNLRLRERVFPIVLAKARIYKALDQLRYVKYWDQRIEQLNRGMKEVEVMANLPGRTDLDRFTEIRASFDRLAHLLGDMNALTPEIHEASGFSTLISAVEGALANELPERDPMVPAENPDPANTNKVEVEFKTKGFSISIQFVLSIIAAIGLVVAAWIGARGPIEAMQLVIQATQTAEFGLTQIALAATPTPSVILTPFVTPSPSPSETLLPSATPTPTIPVAGCQYEGADDGQTIANLIQAEATAANLEQAGLQILKTIFSPAAIIRDYAVPDLQYPKRWFGPEDYYDSRLPDNTRFKDAVHFDILPVGNGISGALATYTSGSQGYYITDKMTDWKLFTNGSLLTNGSITATKFGSEHWVLEKDSQGCWEITHFDFDAGHIPFP